MMTFSTGMAASLGLALLLSGCNADPVPRPSGYFRIALHDTLFSAGEVGCGLGFERSLAAGLMPRLERVGDSCWFDLVYPQYDARLHCTYVHAHGAEDLAKRMDDAFRLAYEHEVRADAIGTRRFNRPDGTSGISFHLTGDAASPMQFVLTDGEDDFFRGALYFNRSANGDSTQTVTDRITYDVARIMETVRWP
jgi:gliding motility-associated lipoprotein GldD